MAPEAAVLKRKRSRPSDYWIVNSNSTPQQSNEAPSKNRRHRVEDNPSQGNIQDDIIALNRGRPSKKPTGQDGEKHDADIQEPSMDKPARRGRTSGTSAELIESSGNHKVAQKIGGRTAKSIASSVDVEQGSKQEASWKRHQLDSEHEAPQSDTAGSSTAVQDTISTQLQLKPTQQSSHRDGPSSNTDAEIGAVTTSPSRTKKVTRKDGKTTSASANAQAQARRRKSARLSDGLNNSLESVNQQPHEGKDMRRKRKRNGSSGPSMSNEVDRGQNEQPQEGEEGKKQTISNISHQPTTGPPSQQSKMAIMEHPPSVDIEIETASSKLTKAKGKRKQDAGPSKASKTNVVKSSSTGEKSQGRKTSGIPSKSASSKAESQRKVSTLSQTHMRKRKESSEEVVEEPNKRQRVKDTGQKAESLSELDASTPYPHLQETTRRVSRQTIQRKWEPLSSSSMDRVSTMLGDLQNPVIARIREDRKKSQASVALKSVSRRLLKKMSMGLPFPPATSRSRDDDFDFERVLDHNRALESQLTPSIHANELLEAELRKEMARLESDKQNLADLETNAKSAAVLRNEAARNLHSLLQPTDLLDAGVIQPDLILADKKVHNSLDASIKGDNNIEELIKSLSGHIDSMQGSVKQVDGIVEALARAKGAVQARLFDHLDATQYEAVVLGSND